ncbi:hypothetical protein ACMD2_11245 [Ananas comosus]|uniref:Uncharacterized protein n=1 Tax=Ananas comosus TaxID=4615 RepID=A0A199V0F7_ANACO|nr:hypothetical protein ACMD2_11245 [Ananas comosus]
MDRESKKKRGREEDAARESKNAKKRYEDVAAEGVQSWGDACRPPPGVFEFPWEGKGAREGLVALESDGWDLRHVFFSSLVDGQRATIGIPGDRLCRPKPAPIAIPDGDPRPSNDADADAECIWAAALREPLVPIVCTGGERKMG